MWKAFGFLFVILIVAASGVWLADHPGQFVVTWFGYRVETSFTLVVVLLLALLALALWAWRLTWRMLGSPAALMQSYGHRRRTKGQDALRQGLVAVAAGNPAEVRKLAARANALLDDAPMTLLLSAQAAQLEGDDKRATKAYKKMLDNPETEFLGLRGLFLQAARNGNRLEALGHAERAFELQPETPWVFNALFELQTAIGEWASAARTLEASVAAKHIDSAMARRRRAVLYARQALAEAAKDDAAEAEKWGLKASDLSPGLVPAAVLAARHHIRSGNLWKAAETIEKAWTAAPHPDLVPVYGEARKGRDPDVADLKADARWLKGLADFNRDHIESRLLRAAQELSLGRLKQARKALKGLDDGYATARVCKLMADIEGAEGNEEAAARWLSKTVTAPRDAHWMCETCGREASAWDSTCNNCGAFDTLSWKAPADLVAGLVLEPIEMDEEVEDSDVSAIPVIIDLVPEPEDEPSSDPDKEPAPAVVAAPVDNPVVSPVVDDPGPDAEDPFSEPEGDGRW